MLLLAIEQLRMTLSAGCRSHIRAPGRIPFPRPPTRFRKVFLRAHLSHRSSRHFGCERQVQNKYACKNHRGAKQCRRKTKRTGTTEDHTESRKRIPRKDEYSGLHLGDSRQMQGDTKAKGIYDSRSREACVLCEWPTRDRRSRQHLPSGNRQGLPQRLAHADLFKGLRLGEHSCSCRATLCKVRFSGHNQ